MHVATPGSLPPQPKLPLHRQLYFQVVVAIVLGAILGHYEPALGESLKPLGDAFIKLVKMIITPVIFLTIVTGIAGMTQLRTVGRVFAKAMVYFLFFSTLALVVGMLVAHLVQPGAGMNVNPADLDQTARAHGAMLVAAEAGDVDAFRAAVVSHYEPIDRALGVTTA